MQFDQVIDRLGKLPRTQRIMVFVVLYVLLVVGFWFIFYGPTVDSLAQAEKQHKELKQQKQTVSARVQNKDAVENELQELMTELRQAVKELPNDREIAGLLKGISNLGKKSGLEMRKFEPLAEVKWDFVAVVPVAIEVHGSFHEVAMFFDRLSKMNRIVAAQDLEITDPDERGGKVNLTVRGRVVTYRFLSGLELEKADTGKKGKKKGKK